MKLEWEASSLQADKISIGRFREDFSEEMTFKQGPEGWAKDILINIEKKCIPVEKIALCEDLRAGKIWRL